MSEIFRSLYSVIPASVRDDAELRPTAKLLYMELAGLAQAEGYCWAGNSHLAATIGKNEKTVESLLKQLEGRGHIRREVERKGSYQTVGIRKIWLLDPMCAGVGATLKNKGSSPQKRGKAPLKNEGLYNKEQNQYNIPPNPPEGDAPKSSEKSRFIPPSVGEVAYYCMERNNGIDAQAFVDHYAANGWKRGNTKIADWKACVRTWEGRRKEQTPPPPQEPAKRVPTRTMDIDGEVVNCYD